jgi:pantothenate kinase type III
VLERVATLDAGNTSLGVVVWRQGRMHACLRLRVGEAPGASARELLAGIGASVAVAVPGRGEPVADLLPGRPAPDLVGRDLPIPGRVHYERPDEMGADRRVACLAAHARHAACLVLDCGTALTLTHVDGSLGLRGMAIATGFATLARGLGTAAPALAPFVGGEPPAGDAVPEGTRANLAVGAAVGWGGLVRALVEDARRRLCRAGVDPGPLVVTGSDATLALAALGEGVHEPSLVHRGLWLLRFGASDDSAP